jgi:hypothetical protein
MLVLHFSSYLERAVVDIGKREILLQQNVYHRTTLLNSKRKEESVDFGFPKSSFSLLG